MRTLIKCILLLALPALFMQQKADAQYRRYDGYYRHGYFPRIGERVYLSRPSYVIPYGGYRYHYLNGIFYRPYGSYFQVIAPPLGIHIGVLPYGYSRIWLGSDPYYYYNGTFYRHWDDASYEVVAPPVGAEVAELPEGARPVVIDNRKFYEYNGTYYKESVKDNGEIWYTVTGKNGDLEQHPETAQPYDQQQPVQPQQQEPAPPVQSRPKPGMEVSSLPEGSRTVIINNQKYFVGPDDTYYQELIENNELFYRVVGKPQQAQ